MNEFVLIFRMDITTADVQPTPELMESYMIDWEKWIKKIQKENKLADGGNHLSKEGKVIRPNNEVIEGPYVEKKESVAGYIIINASSLDEAISIAKECPILKGEGTSVEVRQVGSPY